MLKEEMIKELEKISNYCMNRNCEDCFYSCGEFIDCIFNHAPYKWKIKELKRITQGGIDDGKN